MPIHKLNPVAVQSYLKGIMYPARKQEVVDRAVDNEAPQDIVDVLTNIADRDYVSPADVTREVGSVDMD